MKTAAGILTFAVLVSALLSAPRPACADDYCSLASNFSGAAVQAGINRLAVLAFTPKTIAAFDPAKFRIISRPLKRG